MRLLGLALLFLIGEAFAQHGPSHGFSVFGKLTYSKDFTHFKYTNPNAPKGGELHLGSLGTFDNLNTEIVKGTPAALVALTLGRLLSEAEDCAAEYYGYVAETVEVAPDRTWVLFTLNPKARFNTGAPVTPDDVIWSFETLRQKGLPMYRTYYKNITKVEKVGEHGIKFHNNNPKNAELPLILGQLPIRSKEFYKTRNFDETSLKPEPCVGPYEVESLIPGRQLVLRRVKDWWGADLPVSRGRDNFDRIFVEYFLDQNALFEAFKTGVVELRAENSARLWARSYNFDAVKNGWVKREDIPHKLTSGTYGIFFNLRNPLFQDIRIRKAITLAFDFNWANKNIFYGYYTRNTSYFPNGDHAARGLPSEEELEILEPYKGKIPEEVFTKEFTLPLMKTERELRTILLEAEKLLQEAGYVVEDKVLVNKQTKKPLHFETIIADQSLEKIYLGFAETLSRLGITLKIRRLDTAAFQKRVDDLNYDVILEGIPQSPNLGNEQRDYVGSARADAPGTRNFAGIKNPVIDALIENLIHSDTYDAQIAHARAMDRVLLWNYYMIPAWHKRGVWVVYWDKFSRPEISPKYHPIDFQCWWYDEKKAKILKEKMGGKSASKESDSPSLWSRFKAWFGL